MDTTSYSKIFDEIKSHEHLEGLKIHRHFNKKYNEESLSLKFMNRPHEENYNIGLTLFRKLFTNYGIFQVSGFSHGEQFKIFFKFDLTPENEIKFNLLDFKEKMNFPLLFEHRHKFLDHTMDSFDKRTKIYRDTKLLLKKFRGLLLKL